MVKIKPAKNTYIEICELPPIYHRDNVESAVKHHLINQTTFCIIMYLINHLDPEMSEIYLMTAS